MKTFEKSSKNHKCETKFQRKIIIYAFYNLKMSAAGTVGKFSCKRLIKILGFTLGFTCEVSTIISENSKFKNRKINILVNFLIIIIKYLIHKFSSDSMSIFTNACFSSIILRTHNYSFLILCVGNYS